MVKNNFFNQNYLINQVDNRIFILDLFLEIKKGFSNFIVFLKIKNFLKVSLESITLEIVMNNLKIKKVFLYQQGGFLIGEIIKVKNILLSVEDYQDISKTVEKVIINLKQNVLNFNGMKENSIMSEIFTAQEDN